MKPSNLVKAKNFLSELSASSIHREIETARSQVSSQIQTLDAEHALTGQLSDLIKRLDVASQQINEFTGAIPSIIENINKELDVVTKDYLTHGYVIDGVMPCGDMDISTERNSRKLVIKDSVQSEVSTKIRRYTDWHYPALEIGPGDGVWTEDLVAADPLYLADIKQEYLDNTVNKFNTVFRQRIRPYLINDGEFAQLPENQFSFIFSWNVFNYFPLDKINRYLSECMRLLRPGGVMMFSYNNAETQQSADLVERGFMSWVPKTLLARTCQGLGYEIVETVSRSETVHWIEIKKPGTLKAIKAHQVMGAIRSIHV